MPLFNRALIALDSMQRWMSDQPVQQLCKRVFTKYLSSQILRGLSWTSLSTVVYYLLTFASSVVVARLLEPADFGLFGLASAMMAGVAAFTNLQIPAALIPRDIGTGSERSNFLNTAWTAELIRGSLLVLLVLASSYPASLYFGAPRLTSVIAVVCVGTIIASFKNVGLILLHKDMAFKKISILKQASAFARILVTVVFAFVTRNVYSLALGYIGSSLVSLRLSYLFHSYRPRLSLHRASFEKTFSFGKHLFMVALLTYVNTQFDELVVGRVLGAATLGIYLLAYRIATLPVELARQIVLPVLFPAYAKLNGADGGKVGNVFLSALSAIGLLCIVVACSLSVFGPELILFAYGPKWKDTIALIRPLVFVGLFRTLGDLISSLFLGLNRPELNTRAKCLEVVVFVPATVLLVNIFGINGAAYAGLAAYGTGFCLRLMLAGNLLREVRYRVAMTGFALVGCCVLVESLGWYMKLAHGEFLWFGCLVFLTPPALALIGRTYLGWSIRPVER